MPVTKRPSDLGDYLELSDSEGRKERVPAVVLINPATGLQEFPSGGGGGGGGGLTDVQLRATPVPVSLTSTTVTGTVAVSGPLTDSQLRANPLAVSLASTTVTGTVAVSGPLTDTQLRATALPVSLASTTVTGTVAVSGPLTDTQLRASALAVSLASTTVTGTVAVSGPLTDTQLRATALPVSLASTTVTGTVAVSGPLTDTELRASALPVSLASTTVTGTVAVSGPLTDTQLRATALPVSLASTTVTGTVAVSAVDLGTTADTAATTDSGSFSVIAFIKRALANWTALLARTPALGIAAPGASSPVTLPNDVMVGAAASVAAVNIDLLTGTANGWYDAANFHSVSIQIVGSAGISAGAVFFEQTNDISAAASGNPWGVEEDTGLTPTPNFAALTITASTTRMFRASVTSRYVRVRTSTAFAGGNVQAIACFSQLPYQRMVQRVHQATAGNMNVTATLSANTPTLAAGTNLAADVGLQVRANATGAASFARVIAAGTTNATNLKSSAGRVLGYDLVNNATAVRYLKWHNSASAPTAGTGVVGIVPIGPNGGKATLAIGQGMGFAAGIGYTIVTGAADSDTTAVTANDVVGTIVFA